MTPKDERPKVGIGTMILKGGRVLMGKRRNAHGDGHWSFTGGHLEAGETFVECAVRETREEAGIEIRNVRFLCVGNVRAYGKHYVGVGMVADWASGEPANTEPDKREGWEWVDPSAPPAPLFAMSGMMLESWRTKRLCHDEGQEAVLHGKLVRDRIPDIIRRNDGVEPAIRIAGEDEYARYLAEKLIEEAKEFAETGDPSELSDLLEVYHAVLRHRGIDPEVIERVRREKADARGGFEKRIILEKA